MSQLELHCTVVILLASMFVQYDRLVAKITKSCTFLC